MYQPSILCVPQPQHAQTLPSLPRAMFSLSEDGAIIHQDHHVRPGSHPLISPSLVCTQLTFCWIVESILLVSLLVPATDFSVPFAAEPCASGLSPRSILHVDPLIELSG